MLRPRIENHFLFPNPQQKGVDIAKKYGNESRVAAETGGSQIRQMTEAMDAIKKSSDEVVKIIMVIDEIAFQTICLP